MVKRIIAVGAAAATMLVLAGVAFAGGRHHRGSFNWGTVENNKVIAVSNTGLNHQYGNGDQDMETGRAYADAYQSNVINSSTCGCERRGKSVNLGSVKNNWVVAVSNTGLNEQTTGSNNTHEFSSEGGDHHGRRGGEQEMETGRAESYAWQTNVINSSVGEGDDD